MNQDSIPPGSENTRTFMVPPEGPVFGHYRLGRRLGAGGMGEVYAAVDVNLGRQVALKFLPPSVTADSELKARLLREARSAAALNHPNIVTIYEVGEIDNRPFLAMELVEGETLHARITESGIDILQSVDWVTQIAQGLSEAHAAGVIHRDIKPSNILVDRKGRIRILDFGLAKLGDAEPLTQAGSTLGTVGYMAPEQVEGKPADHRADIFALGVVLYQSLTGRAPFARDTAAATMYAIVHETPEKMSAIRPEIPAALERIVERTIAKAPSMRYQSTEELHSALVKIHDSLTQKSSGERGGQSIAVLPFADMSPNKDQEYFCDGLAEELINALTRIEGLRVVSRTSAFQFKGQQSDIRRIGEQLGVCTVLEGSVRKSGERLRIAAQLITVADGYHLWSEKYDRNADDLFAIQDEISATIVETLKMKLIPTDKGNLVRRSTSNLKAYDLYLQGRFLWNQRTHDGIRRGLACFEKAVELDREFALAYVGVSDSLFIAIAYDFMDPKEAIPRAREAALTALRLDPRSAEAHTALGGIQAYHDWDWVGAERSFLTAIDCNPGYATAHHWYAEVLLLTGRLIEGQNRFNTALELDPLSFIINSMYGMFLHKSGKITEAAERFQRVIELGGRIDLTFAGLGFVLLDLDRTAEGIQCFERALEITGHNSYSICMRGHAAMLVGDHEGVIQALTRLHEKIKSEFVPPTLVAVIEWAAGNKETAYQWFDKAYENHDVELVFLVLPAFDIIRQDPHVTGIFRKIGLTP